MTNIAKSCKGQKVVESYDYSLPEGTQDIEEASDRISIYSQSQYFVSH